MDYRSRNPNINVWRLSAFKAFQKCYPYDGPNCTGITELIAPDQSTVFLHMLGDYAEDENYNLSATYYLIEAPRFCKMRQAFEIGAIDWEDFWFHKGWLIEAKSPSLLGDIYNVRYVDPSVMFITAQRTIAEFAGKNPLQLKFESLMKIRNFSFFGPIYAKQLADLEQNFMHVLKVA